MLLLFLVQRPPVPDSGAGEGLLKDECPPAETGLLVLAGEKPFGDGDGKADLAAVTAAGDLRWYAGDGKGGLAAGKSMWPTV